MITEEDWIKLGLVPHHWQRHRGFKPPQIIVEQFATYRWWVAIKGGVWLLGGFPTEEQATMVAVTLRMLLS